MLTIVKIRNDMAELAKAQLAVAEQYPEGDYPEDVFLGMKERNDKLNELKKMFDQAQEAEALQKSAEEYKKFLYEPVGDPVHPNGQTDGTDGGSTGRQPQGGRRKSVGQQFTEHASWKDFLKSVSPNGYISEKTKITSPPVEFKTLITGLDSGSAGAFVETDRRPFVQLGRRPLVMRNIVTNGTTESDTVDFVRTLAETNNAAPVAEATTTAGGSGVKPESGLTFETMSESVKTIAHWVPATKRSLADAGQVRTLIDDFLLDGLEQELEDQMVNGDGVGQNFTGITNINGRQSQAWDTDLFKTMRKAKTKVSLIGRATPTAYLVNPNDAELIDLAQDNEGRYYYGGPANQNADPRMWRLPVVEAEAVEEGTAFVADFRTLVLADREQGNISMSDSHADFFIRNMVAILAEMRAAFYCLRPAAIVEIDISPAA